MTPLHLASEFGHLGIAQILIMNNANVHVRNLTNIMFNMEKHLYYWLQKMGIYV